MLDEFAAMTTIGVILLVLIVIILWDMYSQDSFRLDDDDETS